MNGDCARAEALIQLLVDRRIDARQRLALDRHLASCPACARAVESYRRLSALASDWARPAASDDPGEAFDLRLMRTIEAETPAPADRRVALPALIASAAAIGGIWLSRGSDLWPTIWASIAPPDVERLAAQAPGAIHEIVASSWDAIGGLLANGSAISTSGWTTEVGAAAIIVNIIFLARALLNRRARSA